MNRKDKPSWIARQIANPFLMIVVVAACLAVAAFYVRDRLASGRLVELSVEENKNIDLTPSQVRSIERIGQWEFLSIADEELVDTTRRRIIGADDQLARIYHGTLRLGIDLSRCREGWVEAHADSVTLHVPQVQLLSEHFIDEARTDAFYESGSWSARDKEQMYQRASRRMRQRSLTRENYQRAEANATEQLSALMRSFGFSHVEVIFGD